MNRAPGKCDFWFRSCVNQFSCSWLTTHATSQLRFGFLWLACVDTWPASLWAVKLGCWETACCMQGKYCAAEFCQLSAILWASPADPVISGNSLLHRASGSWQSLPEWMDLSMLCFVQNSVKGRSSSPHCSRRQGGFHQLWRAAIVCGWATNYLNCLKYLSWARASQSSYFSHFFEWWKLNFFHE